MYKKICLLIVSGFLCGCGVQLSPAQLVGEQTSDVAVQEFLYAGQELAYRYGLDLKMPMCLRRPPGQTCRYLEFRQKA